jgi:hypothetical protein
MERQLGNYKAHTTRVPDRPPFAVPQRFLHADAVRALDYDLCQRFPRRLATDHRVNAEGVTELNMTGLVRRIGSSPVCVQMAEVRASG